MRSPHRPANARARIASALLAAAILACRTLPAAAQSAPPSGESDWPKFRGPAGTGASAAQRLPSEWSADRNVRWRTDLPGLGWSSPIVVGRRVFLTTVESTGEDPQPEKGLYFGGERLAPPTEQHRWKLLALDLDRGDILWQTTLREGPPTAPVHLKNSYASETPVTDGERVYAYFGGLGLFCLDLEGRILWSRDFPPLPMRLGWGTGASPVLADELVVIVHDNEEASYILALDKLTGAERWRVARDERSNWATPYFWRHEQRTEIVTAGTGRVRSYGLDGGLLWELSGMSSITVPTPFAAHGLLYVGSGYVLDLQRPLYAVRPGATGDITLADGQTQSPSIAWLQPKAAPYNTSPLLAGDYLYVLLDRGYLACYDARSGAEVYARQRIEGGRSFTASPWAHGDHVFAINEDGTTFVFRPGPTYELLGTNPLADDDMTLATPAMVDGRLLIRTAKRLYCFEAPQP